MNFLDKVLGRSKLPPWTPSYRATINNVSDEEIREILGRPKKARDDFIFWEGRMSDLDEDLPDDEFYQLSNYDYRRKEQRSRIKGREQWYLYTNSLGSIRLLAEEVGGMPKDIEAVE